MTCIYMWYSPITNKIYVGSAKSLLERINAYKNEYHSRVDQQIELI